MTVYHKTGLLRIHCSFQLLTNRTILRCICTSVFAFGSAALRGCSFGNRDSGWILCHNESPGGFHSILKRTLPMIKHHKTWKAGTRLQRVHDKAGDEMFWFTVCSRGRAAIASVTRRCLGYGRFENSR